jgi:hypothetical protein
MYYVVTEGRARMLDRIDLRDRATYGVDWIVIQAASARDAIRQWGLLKAGVHPTQAEIELETERYRMGTPGYLPVWESESLAVSSKIEQTLGEVQERQRELAGLQDRLEAMRGTLLAYPGRRRAPEPAQRGRRRATRSKGPTRSQRRPAA